jgi:hypothetical protein
VADAGGRLWGWEAGRSCAFRYASGRPIFYTSYEPGNWVTTPACNADPFAADAVSDSKLRSWAWEGGVLCAYKDDHLQPIPATKWVTRIEWEDAPACVAAPTATTAAADATSRLWGWELNR